MAAYGCTVYAHTFDMATQHAHRSNLVIRVKLPEASSAVRVTPPPDRPRVKLLLECESPRSSSRLAPRCAVSMSSLAASESSRMLAPISNSEGSAAGESGAVTESGSDSWPVPWRSNRRGVGRAAGETPTSTAESEHRLDELAPPTATARGGGRCRLLMLLARWGGLVEAAVV